MSDFSFNEQSPASSQTDISASMDGVSRRSQDAANPNRSSGQQDPINFNKQQMLAKIHELPQVRHQLVDNIRKQLDSRTYETPDKLDSAVDTLVEWMVD